MVTSEIGLQIERLHLEAYKLKYLSYVSIDDGREAVAIRQAVNARRCSMEATRLEHLTDKRGYPIKW